MNLEKLKELKLALESEKVFSEEIKRLREQFEINNSMVFKSRDQNRETISNLKSILTENAEAGYEKDGIKKRLGGIGIKIMNKLEYEQNQAMSWAKEHQLCLTLDKKAFEQIAKTQDLDFVTKKEKVTVTFPKEIILEE